MEHVALSATSNPNKSPLVKQRVYRRSKQALERRRANSRAYYAANRAARIEYQRVYKRARRKKQFSERGPKTCVICGRQFLVRVAASSRRLKCYECSAHKLPSQVSERAKARAKAQRQKRAAERLKVKRTCVICGGGFVRHVPAHRLRCYKCTKSLFPSVKNARDRFYYSPKGQAWRLRMRPRLRDACLCSRWRKQLGAALFTELRPILEEMVTLKRELRGRRV